MWMPRTRLFFACTVLVLLGHGANAGDRAPAYAGRFYPGKEAELRSALAECFSHAMQRNGKRPVRAIIVPHAGYVYSGDVAASGIAQIDPQRPIGNVFVIGVSHNAAYQGAAVYVEGDFLTPLGRVPVNAEIGRQLLKQGGIFLENNRAHALEHSLEVQLPFLQYHLKKPFRLVPLLLGTADMVVCKRIAGALRPYYTPDNLFVISTDLSHYPAYQDAVTVDRKTIDAVLTGSAEQLLRTVTQSERSGVRELATCMCGLGGVLVLQELVAEEQGREFRLVQYRNSGDVPIGEKERVVGYAAIAVTQPAQPGETRPPVPTQKQSPAPSQTQSPAPEQKQSPVPSQTQSPAPAQTRPQPEAQPLQQKETFQVPPEDRKELLAIARSTIQEYLRSGHVAELQSNRLSPTLRTPCGAFVTLRKQGELRGCIGNFAGAAALATTVQKMAVAAATEDHRFLPVTSGELKDLEIEISVLTPMRRIESAREIELGRHGIYVRKGGKAGTFLPQVASETGWSVDEFLGHCAQDKAGLGWNGWKDAELFVYEAIVFSENDHATGR